MAILLLLNFDRIEKNTYSTYSLMSYILPEILFKINWIYLIKVFKNWKPKSETLGEFIKLAIINKTKFTSWHWNLFSKNMAEPDQI